MPAFLAPILARLGIIPRWVWLALAAGLLILWHQSHAARQISAARLAGRQEQAAADTAAFRAAQDAATARQDALITAAATRARAISERTSRELEASAVDIDAAVAAKLRAHAAREARAGGAGGDAAAALSGAAASDPEAHCAATGWLPFGRALTLARDAERDAAQARACTGWVLEQQAAWPAPAPDPTPAN
jgi:hypothetical protein